MSVYLYAGRWVGPGNAQNLMTLEKIPEHMDLAQLYVGEYTPRDQDESGGSSYPPHLELLLQAYYQVIVTQS